MIKALAFFATMTLGASVSFADSSLSLADMGAHSGRELVSIQCEKHDEITGEMIGSLTIGQSSIGGKGQGSQQNITYGVNLGEEVIAFLQTFQEATVVENNAAVTFMSSGEVREVTTTSYNFFIDRNAEPSFTIDLGNKDMGTLTVKPGLPESSLSGALCQLGYK
jgi:hypothetical protein